MKMLLRSVALLAGILAFSMADDDWTSQCDKCKCMWSNGRKNADCKNAQLNEIPKTLSNQIRDIDFTNNFFHKLYSMEFKKAGLENVHKLKLPNCSISIVDKNAFRNLLLLIELDLSTNNIQELDRDVFGDNKKLRILSLNKNKLKVLEEGLFHNMSYLQQVFIDDNELETISPKVFESTPIIKHIGLSRNRLKYMAYEFIENLHKLVSLALEENPWVCDCHLEKFRNVSHANNLVTSRIVCEEPERVRGREWSSSVVFACSPLILEPSGTTVVRADSSNVTISCKATGEPRPDIDWKSNGRIIDRDPRQSVQKYFTKKRKVGKVYISELTIINVNYRDRGEYKCVAKNPGGEDEKNLTLVVGGSDGGGTFGPNATFSSDLTLVIILSVGAVVLLGIILILIFCCCKKSRRDNAMLTKNRSINQSSEFINLDGNPEMQKALITEVNPVVKPPRQYSVPPSVTSGGTEVSEVKKMLIDEDSIIAGDDESRSFDFDGRHPLKSQNHLDMDYRNDNPYPPDLLSFPPRAVAQISPAGSSASTVADTSRLPAHHGPQSPLHSPLYDTSSIYRTLPYSRSQSPFTSPLGAPIRVPRQGGYVTIPRRPRQSWSASSEPPTSDIGEPLYDNLGLRTTASGNSVLSLNKLAEPSTPRAAPRQTAYTPMTPTSLPCDPIAEHESPPFATLPRSSSAHRALSPGLEAMRHNWSRSPEQVDSRRESTASLLPTPEGKTPKIPPRPPPKPKKRTSADPLFEDQGEDGTEV